MKRKLLTLTGAALLCAGMAYAQSASILITNSGLEGWNNYTVFGTTDLSIPDNWHGSDSLVAALAPVAGGFGISISPKQQIFQSTEAHGGQAAAQLFSRDLGGVGVQPAALSNGTINIDIMGIIGGGGMPNPSELLNYLQFNGGEPVSGQVASVSAWMKNGDSMNVNNYGFMALALKKINADSFAIVGQGAESVSPGNLAQYSEITVNLIYPDPDATPDYLVVVFTSSDIADTVSPKIDYNSVLVDDVSYKMAGTGVKIPLMTENEMLVYPVPAKERVFFNLKSNTLPSDYSLKITDLAGKVISNELLEHQINAKDVSSWAKGIYFYQLTNGETHRMQTGKFIVN